MHAVTLPTSRRRLQRLLVWVRPPPYRHSRCAPAVLRVASLDSIRVSLRIVRSRSCCSQASCSAELLEIRRRRGGGGDVVYGARGWRERDTGRRGENRTKLFEFMIILGGFWFPGGRGHVDFLFLPGMYSLEHVDVSWCRVGMIKILHLLIYTQWPVILLQIIP